MLGLGQQLTRRSSSPVRNQAITSAADCQTPCQTECSRRVRIKRRRVPCLGAAVSDADPSSRVL